MLPDLFVLGRGPRTSEPRGDKASISARPQMFYRGIRKLNLVNVFGTKRLDSRRLKCGCTGLLSITVVILLLLPLHRRVGEKKPELKWTYLDQNVQGGH